MVRFLKSVSSGTHGGLASYRPRERATRAMTAEALVCRQFLGMTRDNPAANEAGDYLLTELPSNEPINLYYWYYGTLGTYQLQGEHWRKWNAALQKTLLDRQVTRGAAAGSWDPRFFGRCTSDTSNRSNGSTLRPRTREVKAGFARALEEKVWPLLSAGKVKVVLDSTFQLAAAAAAHRRLETSQHIGKIVLTV